MDFLLFVSVTLLYIRSTWVLKPVACDLMIQCSLCNTWSACLGNIMFYRMSGSRRQFDFSPFLEQVISTKINYKVLVCIVKWKVVKSGWNVIYGVTANIADKILLQLNTILVSLMGISCNKKPEFWGSVIWMQHSVVCVVISHDLSRTSVGPGCSRGFLGWKNKLWDLGWEKYYTLSNLQNYYNVNSDLYGIEINWPFTEDAYILP